MERARSLNLSAFALTDHDTVAGVADCAELAKAAGIKFIAGVEFESVEGPHLLGYFSGQPGQPILEAAAAYRAFRADWVVEMVEKVNPLGYQVDKDAVLRRARDGTPHVAHLVAEMHARGCLQTQDRTCEEYRRLFGSGGPAEPSALTDKLWTAVDLVRMIRRSGAVAVLAHPTSPLRMDLWPELVNAGLQGIEAYHRNNHIEKNVSDFSDSASERGLIVTGGWDYHGEAQATRLAQVDLTGFAPPDHLLDPLLELMESARA